MLFIFSFLFLNLIFQQIQTQPTTCVTCINCQDLYDGTDINSTCSSTLPNADSCQKTRIQLPGTVMVSKACAKSCQENSIIAGTFRLEVTCCTSSNCNKTTIIKLQLFLFFILLFIVLYRYVKQNKD